MAALPAEVKAPARLSLVEKFAAKYNIEATRLMTTLKATAFRVDNAEVSNEQMAALLVVSDQYGLNPFTKEIFAFPDKHKGIVPVVSIDGWSRIINEHSQYDGVEFVDGPVTGGIPEFIECVIHRKDRAHPTKIRERFDECKRETGPWKSHPARMLRHKALIQCARVAFGFAGIFDEDEAERIIERDVTPPAEQPQGQKVTRSAAVAEKLRPAAQAPIEAEVIERKPPSITLAEVVGYIEKASSRDIAAEALDLGNSLPDEERKAAKQEFDKRWPVEGAQ